jgi:hypothetical protein
MDAETLARIEGSLPGHKFNLEAYLATVVSRRRALACLE